MGGDKMEISGLKNPVGGLDHTGDNKVYTVATGASTTACDTGSNASGTVTTDGSRMTSTVQSTIERLALGNPIGLGYLYNACSDKPCSVSLLKEAPPSECICITDIPSTESDYVHIKSASDKFRSLNVAAELKVSLYCGLVNVKGSGKYFKDEKTSARSVTISLIHKITTKHEYLGILDDRLRGSINLDALKHRGATHVVTGITWGGNLMVTAEYKNEENRDVQEIAGHLEAELRKISIQIEGSGNVDMKDGDSKDSCKFELKIVGDVLVPGQLPQTIEGAMALVAELSSQVKISNNGKGVPVRYELTALEDIRSYFTFSVRLNSTLHTLEDQTILRLVSIFDEINVAKQKLNDFCDDVDRFENHLADNARAEIKELRHETAVAESEFRGQLQTLLVQVRSGLADASDLEDLKKEYESGPYSPSRVLLKLGNDFRSIRMKIENLQQFASLGIKIVPKQVQSLATKLLEFKDKQVYVIFGQSDGLRRDEKLWGNYLCVLRTLAGDPSVAVNSEFLYVDLNSAPHLRPEQSADDDRKIHLQRFNKRGKCVDEDAYKTFQEEQSVCYAFCDNLQHTTKKHNNVAVLELPCPKFYIGKEGEPCGRELHKWKCFHCKAVIDWGFDGFFYCSCGKGPAASYKFRCSQPEHEDEFYGFSAGPLKEYLDKLRRIKELNIVVLGETGVGKSTWINGILNYRKFSSLDEAIEPQADLLYAIPMSFSMDDGSGVMVKVQVGEDENEQHKEGSSATQSAVPYTLRNGNQLIRLIDTPGICDTRGIEQDKKNMENILRCLQNYDEIHGICILLLPNMPRISAAFTFCIKELLTHLHMGASQNIVFCYTNSRGHMYRPAETSACLRTLLKDINRGIELSYKTQYSIDNEAIRFLAAYKSNMVTFPPEFVELFAASWTHSAKETARLFKHISDLPPHATQDTLSLNQVRRIITDLGRPLGETAKNIDDNIRIAEEHKEKLKRIDLKSAELEKDARIPVSNLKTVNIEFPRTVCSGPKCVKLVQGKHNVTHRVYSQICHNQCTLVITETGCTNERELRRCAAMRNACTDSAECIHCGCSWKVHMHIKYDVELEDDFDEVAEIRDELDKEKKARRIVEETMEKTDKRILQLTKEKEAIAESSARFAVFLKRNAVCLFNDATADYLDYLIENEKTNDKIAQNLRNSSVTGLQKMKRDYEEHKKVLQEKLKNAEGQQKKAGLISVEEIQREILKLYGLPYNGSTIKLMMAEATKATQNSTHIPEIQLDAIGSGLVVGNETSFGRQAMKKVKGFFSRRLN